MGFFKNILVHADGRNECRDLITCAVELAEQQEARLKLVDVVPKAPWPSSALTGNMDRFLDQLTDAKQTRLQQLAAEFQSDTLAVTHRVLQAPTSVAIIREAILGEHDLVIKAVKGAESQRSGFFGTSARRLLRKCPMPLLLVKPDFTGPFSHIVAAVDATSEHERDVALNGEIIQMAKHLCADTAGPHLLHAWSLYGASILKEHMRPEELAEAVEKTEQHAQRCIDQLVAKYHLNEAQELVHLIQGDPINVIPGFVAETNPDLLVMGTVGRSGVAGLLMGNTAEQILESIACSVLAVKPPGFETPIRA